MTEFKDLPQNAQAAIKTLVEAHEYGQVMLTAMASWVTACRKACEKHHPDQMRQGTGAELSKECEECGQVLYYATAVAMAKKEVDDRVGALNLVARPVMAVNPDSPEKPN